MSRQLIRTAGVMGAIAICCWVITGLAVRVGFNAGAASYPVSLQDASWIQAPDHAPRAWFRDQLIVRSSATAMTLWYDTPDIVAIDINGTSVPLSYHGDVNAEPDVPNSRPLIDAVDLSAFAVQGLTTIVFDVTSQDRSAAKIRAKLVVTGNNQSTSEYTSSGSSSTWLVTSNAALLHINGLGGQPAFSASSYPTAGWSAVTAATGRAASRAMAPESVVDRPAPDVGVQASISDAVLSRTLTLGSLPSWAWLRLWTNGISWIDVNGTNINAGGIGNIDQLSGAVDSTSASRSNTIPLFQTAPHGETSYLVDIRPWLHTGTNSVRIHVTGSLGGMSLLGDIVSSGGATSLADTGWRATDTLARSTAAVVTGAQALSGMPATAGTGQSANRPIVTGRIVKVRLTSDLYSEPANIRWIRHTLYAGLLFLGCAATIALLTRKGRHRVLPSTALVLVSLLPSVGLVLVANRAASWSEAIPPWPYSDSLAVVTVALASVGLILAAVTALPHRYRHRGIAPRLAWRSVIARWRDRQAGRTLRRLATVNAAIWLIAIASTALLAYRLSYEPLWQDELSSLAAAEGIRAHILPQWPSGFLYFKSELYSAVIAVIGGLFGDGPVPLRLPSVLLHGATVVLFGRGLLPLVVKRNDVRIVATLVFAIAPIELLEARDIRMYQMVQFMAVAFLLALLRAARAPTRRGIWTAAILLVAMYLTHEESFCLLLAVPVILSSEVGLSWIRQRRWLAPGLCAGTLILVQVALAKFTHPPAFGEDASFTPFLRWQPDPFYYLDYLTRSSGSPAPMLFVTLLALAGLLVGIARRDRNRIYLGVLVMAAILSLSLVLPAKEPRYVFIILPFLFALAGCAVEDIVNLCASVYRRWRVPILFRGLTACIAGALALANIAVGVSDFGVGVGNALGVPVPLQHGDYDVAGNSVRADIASTDILIAAVPANLVGEYFGRTPDYWMPNRAGSRMLYLIEKKNAVVDTQYGVRVLLTGADLQNVVASGHRVWLVVATSLVGDERQVLSKYFQLVARSRAVLVYESVAS